MLQFGTSNNHLDCIPAEPFVDISVLDASHIPMLNMLQQLAREELQSRNLPWLPKDEPIDDLITYGYNFPVSVKHLHLHAVLSPYFHDAVFTAGRWHSHDKVIRDLKQFGRVRLYSDLFAANDAEAIAESNAVVARAHALSRRLGPLKAAYDAAAKK